MVNSNQIQEHTRKKSGVDLFDPHRAMQRSRSQASVATSNVLSVTSNVPPATSSLPTRQKPSRVTNHFYPPYPSSQSQAQSETSSVRSGIATFTPQPAEQRHEAQRKMRSEGMSSMADVLGIAQPRPSQSKQQRRRPKHQQPRPQPTQAARRSGRSPKNMSYLLAGSSLLAGLVVMGDVSTLFSPKPPSNVCQEVVQSDATLSREHLSRLIAIPERQSKASIRDIVAEPYCVLPSVEVRAGAIAEREAYPLAFDPQTWVVVLYEGEEYAGYSFSFQP